MILLFLLSSLRLTNTSISLKTCFVPSVSSRIENNWELVAQRNTESLLCSLNPLKYLRVNTMKLQSHRQAAGWDTNTHYTQTTLDCNSIKIKASGFALMCRVDLKDSAMRLNTVMYITPVYAFVCFIFVVYAYICASHTFVLFTICPRERCVCILSIHLSTGGHPGAFLTRQMQHIPLQAKKRKRLSCPRC